MEYKYTNKVAYPEARKQVERNSYANIAATGITACKCACTCGNNNANPNQNDNPNENLNENQNSNPNQSNIQVNVPGIQAEGVQRNLAQIQQSLDSVSISNSRTNQGGAENDQEMTDPTSLGGSLPEHLEQFLEQVLTEPENGITPSPIFPRRERTSLSDDNNLQGQGKTKKAKGNS